MGEVQKKLQDLSENYQKLQGGQHMHVVLFFNAGLICSRAFHSR